MKIKSVETISTPETVQHELVLKNRAHRSIITEGSILECDAGAKEEITDMFGKPSADLTEIGMIVIDTEDRYRKFLHKARFNSELDQLDNQTFSTVLNEHASNPKVRTALQESLGELTKTRLGLIFDGLGSDYDAISERKKQLESMGYDCMVCFVNVSLQEVVARRNGAGISESQASDLWKESQKNIARYSELFEGNIVVVDGSSPDKFMKGIEFAVENFVVEPVQNEVGQNIVIRSKTIHQMG